MLDNYTCFSQEKFSNYQLKQSRFKNAYINMFAAKDSPTSACKDDIRTLESPKTKTNEYLHCNGNSVVE